MSHGKQCKLNIWCHFTDEIKGGKVVNSWVLTDIETYKEALKKDRHETIKNLHRDLVKYGGSVGEHRIIDPYKRGLDTTFTYARDSLEVFIQKKDIGKIR